MNVLSKILCLLCVAILGGQNMSAEIFTGKMEMVSFQNIDEKTIQYSSGIGYNGACKESVIVNATKTLVKNNSLQYSTLLDADAKKVVIWCEKMGEGVEIDYKTYLITFNTFVDEPRVVMNYTVPPYKYNLKQTAANLEAFGKPACFYSGTLENDNAGVSVQLEVIPSLECTPALQCILLYGLNVKGLPVKFRWNIDNRVEMLGQFKSYKGLEVESIDSNYTPSDSDFSIPGKVKIKRIKIWELDGFLQKIGKYLKKNKLFPDQTGNEFIYELNEDEWSY